MINELAKVHELGWLRLEHALEDLSMIYTQLTIFAAKGADSNEAANLAGEISHEIEQANAVLMAMDRIPEPAGLESRA